MTSPLNQPLWNLNFMLRMKCQHKSFSWRLWRIIGKALQMVTQIRNGPCWLGSWIA